MLTTLLSMKEDLFLSNFQSQFERSSDSNPNLTVNWTHPQKTHSLWVLGVLDDQLIVGAVEEVLKRKTIIKFNHLESLNISCYSK